MNETIINNTVQHELESLRSRLEEANETINAIRTGKIDALLVQDDRGTQLYTLRSADQTYRVFIENMNEGAVTINALGIILYCNSRFATIVKLPLTKVIGVKFETFIPDVYKEVYTDIINKGWQSDSKGEIYVSDSKDDLIPFLLSVTKMEIEDGFALSLLLTDLSIQKENEKQLRIKNDALELAELNARKLNLQLENKVNERTKDLLLSRERFKFLAENIPVIIWTADHNGDVDYANKRWYEYSGLNFQQTKNSGLSIALHPDDSERATGEWKKSVRENNPMHIEYRIKRASDGAYRWHICSALPFANEEGITIAWFATCTDIHDQKLAIEKKEEFISIASHELKTPLTGLKGYMQIMEMRKEELSPAFYSYFTRANQSVLKLQHLITDLLDVSRIQAGKLNFTTSVISVDELINACIEEFKIIYPDFKIIKDCEPGLYVTGNFERLEQVIVNLTDNAVKYTRDIKEIIIDVKMVDSVVFVSVIDFGIGLTNENKEKIFDRFFRVEESEYKTSGLGMGLYISSEIIKRHKGQMHVASELGKGSSFSFSLPEYKQIKK